MKRLTIYIDTIKKLSFTDKDSKWYVMDKAGKIVIVKNVKGRRTVMTIPMNSIKYWFEDEVSEAQSTPKS